MLQIRLSSNLHFKSPAELLLLGLRSDQIICHDELLKSSYCTNNPCKKSQRATLLRFVQIVQSKEFIHHLEIEVSVPISVQSAEHVVAEAHRR